MEKVVIKDTCIGCGMCVHQNPDYITFNDEGHAEALNKEIDPKDKASILESVEACPVEAVSVVEEK